MNLKPVISRVCSLQSIGFQRINKASSHRLIELHKHLSMITQPMHIYRFALWYGEVKQQVCTTGYY